MNLLRAKNWGDARLTCQSLGGRLAVFQNGVSPKKITKFIADYTEERIHFFVGAYAASDGRWITVKNEELSSNSSLWGPYEPSGDGWCGDLIFGQKWDQNWRGKGWRINDEPCLSKQAFVCQMEKHDSGKDVGSR